MPATTGQRLTKVLLAIAEDPASSTDQKLAALAQLTQLQKGRKPHKRRPNPPKDKRSGSLLGE
jgi:hypothetical protein